MTREEKRIVAEFAASMKKYRERRGISQEKLAEYANLHRTYIGALERAQKIPSLITIVKISKALEVSVFDLINY